MSFRRLIPILLWICLIPTLLAAQAAPEFESIGPIPADHSLDQVQMEEFVNFTCPHCNNFRLASKSLREKYGRRLRSVLLPVAFTGQPDTPLRLYFIAERAGSGKQMEAMIFDAAFRYGVDVYDSKIVSYLARSAGLAAEYEKEANAAWVTAKVQAARARADQIGLEATPTIVLNGALRFVPRGGMDAFVANLDRTLARLLK